MSDSETIVLADTALESDTVQVDDPPEPSVDGAQDNDVSETGALSVIVEVRETPASVAVTVAEPSVGMVAAVAANVADD